MTIALVPTVSTANSRGVESGHRLPSSAQWAAQNFGQLNLGDQRLNKRAFEMAAQMAAHPEASLPNQMQSHTALIAAYRVLNNEAVDMARLLEPHCRQTIALAGQYPLVLMVEDTTELDFTKHRSKTGLGPVGNGKGQGLLLHDTLAVLPESRQVLGLAHLQVVLREPSPAKNTHYTDSPESRLWAESAKQVGLPPEGVTWVHVSDRGSDDFGYMVACSDRGKHFLLRAFHNRRLHWDAQAPEADDPRAAYLLDYVRSLPPFPNAGYRVHVPRDKGHPARDADVEVCWTKISFAPAKQGLPELRRRAPLVVWALRVWEPNPPAGVEAIEWIVLSSLPINSVEDAHQGISWYTCRWLCEDFHMCLKTGCHVEDTQLDDGADIRRLLGFAAPIAVRLLQLRQAARETPDLPAIAVAEPLMVAVLARLQKRDGAAMTVIQFWQGVTRLGGHQGRRGDGPSGWRTVWRGWRYLSDLTEGARLFASELGN